jgi:hypothetical protein
MKSVVTLVVRVRKALIMKNKVLVLALYNIVVHAMHNHWPIYHESNRGRFLYLAYNNHHTIPLEASYYLAVDFLTKCHRRRFKKIGQSETRIASSETAWLN